MADSQVRGVFPECLQRRLGGEISITSFFWSHCNAVLYSFLGIRTSHTVYNLTNPVPPVQNTLLWGWNYPSNGRHLTRLFNNSEIMPTKQKALQIQGTGPQNTRSWSQPAEVGISKQKEEPCPILTVPLFQAA